MTYREEWISEDEGFFLIRKNIKNIEDIKNPTENIQLEIIKYDNRLGVDIKVVEDKDQNWKMWFILNRKITEFDLGKNIELEIYKQKNLPVNLISSGDVIDNLEAIKMNGKLIRFFQNPTDKMIFESIKQDWKNLTYINTNLLDIPTISEILLILENDEENLFKKMIYQNMEKEELDKKIFDFYKKKRQNF